MREGTCNRRECRYAHSSADLRVSPVLLKTKMCSFFMNGKCVVGEACRFAHSVQELQEAAGVQQERQPFWDLRRTEFLPPQGPSAPAAAAAIAQAAAALMDQSCGRRRPGSVRAPPEAGDGPLHGSEARFSTWTPDRPRLPSSPKARAVAAVDAGQPPDSPAQRDGALASGAAASSSGPASSPAAEPRPAGPVALDNSDDIDGLGEESLSQEAGGRYEAQVTTTAGRVVIATASLDADAGQDATVDVEDVAWRKARALSMLPGVGAAVFLQSRLATASRASRAVIDIEDLSELGSLDLCKTCDFRDKRPHSAERTRRGRPRGAGAGGPACLRRHSDTIGVRVGVSTPCSEKAQGLLKKFKNCALCSEQHHRSEPCAACDCNIRIVCKNTFLTFAEEDAEKQEGSRRRTRSF